jgi:hypothetical protein
VVDERNELSKGPVHRIMSLTAGLIEQTSLKASFTGQKTKLCLNPMWQMLWAGDCLWSTTLGTDLYQERFSPASRQAVQLMLKSRVKYWHWVVEIGTFFVIVGPAVWNYLQSNKSNDKDMNFDGVPLPTTIVLKILGTLLTLCMFIAEAFSLYVLLGILFLDHIGICWAALPGNMTLPDNKVNDFLEFEVSQALTAGIIADSENMTLVAMCQSRRITRFKIMLYHNQFMDKFSWVLNSLFSLARLVCGLLACFTLSHTSIIFGFFILITMDFMIAWCWYNKHNSICS